MAIGEAGRKRNERGGGGEVREGGKRWNEERRVRIGGG